MANLELHYIQVWSCWQPQSLSNLVALMSTQSGNSLRVTILKLAFTSTLYHVWIERNMRKFQNESSMVPIIVKEIYLDVRFRLMSLSNFNIGGLSDGLLAVWNPLV